jgi:competence protein ComEA
MIRSVLTVLCTTLALLAGPGAIAADVNQAGAAELEAVKGIGPALSGKILAARQQGAFKSWADLVDRVSGLGTGNAARLSQNGLTVAGATYVPAAAAQAPAAKPARDAAPKKPAKAQG